MSLTKRYVLKLFFSLKYTTANVVDRNNGRIVSSASSVEAALKHGFGCNRTCNAKAAAVVGEVLAMRIKVEGVPQIHCNVKKELDKEKNQLDRQSGWMEWVDSGGSSWSSSKGKP
ncbi:hypothetical protein EJ110_NYTH22340 [Nymphaea thermarum]|nr:hypothetical protein EJ110_NYTH22340 [Nymphaea thermarum]